ncbi:MAG: hypothetical protein KF901_17330 [Myxococcales bacterium]|nr:hypothetical protein [Myxococcales bacterium]
MSVRVFFWVWVVGLVGGCAAHRPPPPSAGAAPEAAREQGGAIPLSVGRAESDDGASSEAPSAAPAPSAAGVSVDRVHTVSETTSVSTLGPSRTEARRLWGELIGYDDELRALGAVDCGAARDLRDRICDLSRRVCDIAEERSTDSSTRERCDDGQARCADARRRVASTCP